MIDYLEESPSRKLRPRWLRALNTLSIVLTGDIYSWTGNLEAEVYTLLCNSDDPHELWFGTGLTVED